MALKPLCDAAAGWLLAAASAQSNPYYDPAKPHHTPEGFRNNYIGKVDKSMGDLLRWRIDAARAGLPRPPQQPTPVAVPELARLKAGTPSPSFTWIGHSTALVQSGGLNIPPTRSSASAHRRCPSSDRSARRRRASRWMTCHPSTW